MQESENKVKITPVITTADAKVICISGEAGDVLSRHKVNDNALLLVKKGQFRYLEGETMLDLSAGEGHSIPADTFHALSCTTEAEAFLVIPIRAKIRFEKTEDA